MTAGLVYTSASPAEPAQRRRPLPEHDYCLCAGEIQQNDRGRWEWRHSRACAVRRHDGSLPPRWPPNPIMPEPDPEEIAERQQSSRKRLAGAARGEAAAEARRMRDQGVTLAVIAARFGVSIRTAFGLSGGARPVVPRVLPAEPAARQERHEAERTEARRLRSQGETYAAIAARFGVSRQAVWQWLNDAA